MDAIASAQFTSNPTVLSPSRASYYRASADNPTMNGSFVLIVAIAASPAALSVHH